MGRINITYIILDTVQYHNWEISIRAHFEARDDIISMNKNIAETKGRLLKINEADDLEISAAYRNLKIRRQLKWLNFYENELVKILESGLNDARRHHSSELYIAVMPEVLIRDDDYESKHPYNHYVNPLYEEVVEIFLGAEKTRKRDGSVERYNTEKGARTLLSFTQSNQDVIVFAGTIWWKQLHRDYPKGILFNSAPVFFNAKCCFLWDKQYLSSSDGVPSGNLLDQWIKYRVDYMPMTQPIMGPASYPEDIRSMEECIQNYYDSVDWPEIGIISNLTKQFNPYANPLLAITLPNGERLVFGIDICMDDYYKEGTSLSQHFFKHNVFIRIGNSALHGEPLKADNADKPHIQIIVANSFGRYRNYFSRSTVCLCDMELAYNSQVLRLNPLNESFNPCTLTDDQSHFFLISDSLELELSAN